MIFCCILFSSKTSRAAEIGVEGRMQPVRRQLDNTAQKDVALRNEHQGKMANILKNRKTSLKTV